MQNTKYYALSLKGEFNKLLDFLCESFHLQIIPASGFNDFSENFDLFKLNIPAA